MTGGNYGTTSDGYYRIPRLDRVITVGIAGPETFEDGTPIAGVIVDSEMWAAQVDRRELIDRRSGPGGIGLITRRTYRLRWSESLVGSLADNNVSVVVAGERYQVDGWLEVGRRRWLEVDIWIGAVGG